MADGQSLLSPGVYTEESALLTEKELLGALRDEHNEKNAFETIVGRFMQLYPQASLADVEKHTKSVLIQLKEAKKTFRRRSWSRYETPEENDRFLEKVTAIYNNPSNIDIEPLDEDTGPEILLSPILSQPQVRPIIQEFENGYAPQSDSYRRFIGHIEEKVLQQIEPGRRLNSGDLKTKLAAFILSSLSESLMQDGQEDALTEQEAIDVTYNILLNAQEETTIFRSDAEAEKLELKQILADVQRAESLNAFIVDLEEKERESDADTPSPDLAVEDTAPAEEPDEPASLIGKIIDTDGTLITQDEDGADGDTLDAEDADNSSYDILGLSGTEASDPENAPEIDTELQDLFTQFERELLRARLKVTSILEEIHPWKVEKEETENFTPFNNLEDLRQNRYVGEENRTTLKLLLQDFLEYKDFSNFDSDQLGTEVNRLFEDRVFFDDDGRFNYEVESAPDLEEDDEEQVPEDEHDENPTPDWTIRNQMDHLFGSPNFEQYAPRNKSVQALEDTHTLTSEPEGHSIKLASKADKTSQLIGRRHGEDIKTSVSGPITLDVVLANAHLTFGAEATLDREFNVTVSPRLTEYQKAMVIAGFEFAKGEYDSYSDIKCKGYKIGDEVHTYETLPDNLKEMVDTVLADLQDLADDNPSVSRQKSAEDYTPQENAPSDAELDDMADILAPPKEAETGEDEVKPEPNPEDLEMGDDIMAMNGLDENNAEEEPAEKEDHANEFDNEAEVEGDSNQAEYGGQCASGSHGESCLETINDTASQNIETAQTGENTVRSALDSLEKAQMRILKNQIKACFLSSNGRLLEDDASYETYANTYFENLTEQLVDENGVNHSNDIHAHAALRIHFLNEFRQSAETHTGHELPETEEELLQLADEKIRAVTSGGDITKAQLLASIKAARQRTQQNRPNI